MPSVLHDSFDQQHKDLGCYRWEQHLTEHRRGINSTLARMWKSFEAAYEDEVGAHDGAWHAFAHCVLTTLALPEGWQYDAV